MIERVGIVAKRGLHGAIEHLGNIATWLDGRGVGAVFERETADMAGLPASRPRTSRDDLPLESDLILVLGGDGTLIGMADRIACTGRDVPILGVNVGSLGFLTEITLPELYASLEAAVTGTAPIDERMMLRASVGRRGKIVEDRLVLNDVVVARNALAGLIDLSVSVGGQFVARFNADGLIIASPTGSTAYNLSAGGPIVHPAVDAIVITPIAPHILTNRPVVIPASDEITIQPVVRTSGHEIFVSLDGQSGLRLEPDDEVTVRAGTKRLRLVRASTRTYFQILREKLKWAER
jgi:NAD+ kinase